MTLLIRQAQREDFPAVEQLLELYQYELSDIWPQEMDESARYGFDLTRHKRAEGSRAYVAKLRSRLIGFALTAPAIVTRYDGTWMEQFFIHRQFRRTGAGRALARYVFQDNPGPWEVGQIPGNIAAMAFWRAVIGEMTNGTFVEIEVTQGWWKGVVQQFTIPNAA
jgi:predicted acetyltransferase